MLVDLHTHTTFSDGRLTPAGLVSAAARSGLGAVAITDHDAIDGCLALGANPAAIPVVCGIEFSTDDEASEVHILGLGINPRHAQLAETVRVLRRRRLLRIEMIVDKLTHLGYDLSVDDVLQCARSAHALGRPHAAQALVQKNYFASVKEAFHALLHHNGPAYVPHAKLPVREAVDTIHAAGGVAIVAHPGLITAPASFQAALAAGVDGIEAFHPRHSAAQVREYNALAANQRLLVSGGSDFHAIPGRYPVNPGMFAIAANSVRPLLNRLGLLK